MENSNNVSIFDLLRHTKGLDQITLKLFSDVHQEFNGYFVHDGQVTLFGSEISDFHDYLKNIYPIKYTFYVNGLHSFCLYVESYYNTNK